MVSTFSVIQFARSVVPMKVQAQAMRNKNR
jgi:hypothetical protein